MPTVEWPQPWPIGNLISAIQEGDALAQLVAGRTGLPERDIREHQLERLFAKIAMDTFGADNVAVRRQLKSTLGLRSAAFPGSSQPDLVIRQGGRMHICEVKSNRVDYGRFDCVFESKPFREFLAATGHAGGPPWEVEQDLIKLHLYPMLSPQVGSCLFLMVDAFTGPGISWSRVFGSPAAFQETMRTSMIQGMASTLLAATRIVPLRARGAAANLIVCEISQSVS